jgi:hypothetical protein
MNTRLKAFKNQADAHAELERLIAGGQHPSACCREDPNDEFPYQVWDSAPPAAAPPPPEKAAGQPIAVADMPAAMLDELAKRTAMHMLRLRETLQAPSTPSASTSQPLE